MTIHYVEQGGPEWHALRLGKVTASHVGDVCKRQKNGAFYSKRGDYKAKLILERLTGLRQSAFTTKPMDAGKLLEPDARAEYELRRRCEVQQVGFVDHPSIPMAGGSPDGFVGGDGLVEFKCPTPLLHLEYLRGGAVPDDYVHQIIWNFACNPDRSWCDFASFNPDFPPAMQLFVAHAERDDVQITKCEAGVTAFLAEVDQEVAELRATYIERRNVLAEKLKASAEMAAS